MSEPEGRDLDRAIAELTGWVQRKAWSCDRCYCEDSGLPTLGGVIHWQTPPGYMNDGSSYCFVEPPRYTESLDACAKAEKVLLDEGWVCEIGLAKSDNYEACGVEWFVNIRAANFHPPAVEMYAREELPLRAQALYAALLLRAKTEEGEA